MRMFCVGLINSALLDHLWVFGSHTYVKKKKKKKRIYKSSASSWQTACIEGTGESRLPGDQADRFSPTVSFLWSHQKSRFLSCSLQAWILNALLLVLLRHSLIIQSDQLLSSPKLLNPSTSLFYWLSLLVYWLSFPTGYQSAAGFNTK